MTEERLIKLLGRLPEKVAPEMRVLDEVDCGSYSRRTIEYFVEADERITAFICVPHEFDKSLPGVYCFHQHAGNRLLGKSEVVGLAGDPDQAYASELAERGFVTIAPDATCFEDRCQNKDSPDYNHVHQLHLRLMRGQTLLGKVLHDVSASIDVLMNLPEVDADRIGFIGHSYGGRTALFAPVFDRRIRASVCSCGSSNFRDMDGIQFDFVVPNFLNYGDVEDVVRLLDPAHALILGGEADKWSVGIEEMVNYAKDSFEFGSLDFEVFSGGHVFNAEMRERAYSFLEKHLES